MLLKKQILEIDSLILKELKIDFGDIDYTPENNIHSNESAHNFVKNYITKNGSINRLMKEKLKEKKFNKN